MTRLAPILCLACAAICLRGGAAGAAAGCDTTWNGSSGNWSEAENWSAGLPTASTDACINGFPGAYTVDVTDARVARSLTVGDSAAETQPTLRVRHTGSLRVASYTQGSNGLSEFDLVGTAFAQMTVSGRASLAGQLYVGIATGAGAPPDGERRIIAAGSRTGTFSLLLPTPGVNVLYDASGVVVSKGAAPTPVRGETVAVRPVSGVVRVRTRGSSRFVALRDVRSIPVGSELDTTGGTVALASAKDARGTPQTARFRGGRFLVRQGGGSSLTTAALSGRELRACPAGRRASASARRRPRRRLFGSGKGSYRTTGRYGSAAIRGTDWLVEDLCDRTRITAQSGVVTVRDFVKRRTVRLTTGRSYTALAPD